MADPNDPRLAAARNHDGSYGSSMLSADEYLAGLGGTTPSAGGLSPSGLAATFRQPNVTLPGAEAAKTGLRDLQTNAVGGMQKLLASDPQAERQKLIDAIYGNASSDINYSADRLSRDTLEGQNAKNMLYSTGTSYMLDPIERGRATGLEKAANDAFVQANSIGNANEAQRTATLGAAFNSGTTGLQGEANVESANRTANQAATQAGYQTGAQLGENAANRGQQEGQFTRALGQQNDLQTQAFQNTKDIASGSAIGAGVGGLASVFAPTLNNALTSFFKPSQN